MDGWALATIAAVLLAFAAASGWFQRLYVTAAMFFVTAGLLAGPVLGLLDLNLGGEPVKLLAEVTLTLVLFADASRISLSALRNEFSVPLRLLGIGLPLTIVAGALAGVALLPGVGLAEAFLLAVILACTDAALGQAVVTDERLPSRIRQGLVERGPEDCGVGGVVAGVIGVGMVPVALAMLGTGARRPTVAFLGWFGPRGLASIVFGVMMLQEGGLPHERSLLLAIVLTVGISVYAHGVSAGPLTERYVAWFTSHPQDRRPAMESVSASEHRWRTPGAVRG